MVGEVGLGGLGGLSKMPQGGLTMIILHAEVNSGMISKARSRNQRVANRFGAEEGNMSIKKPVELSDQPDNSLRRYSKASVSRKLMQAGCLMVVN